MDLSGGIFNIPFERPSPQPLFAGAPYHDITDGSRVLARQCWQDEILPGGVAAKRGEWVVKMASGKLNACDHQSFMARFGQIYPRAADREESNELHAMGISKQSGPAGPARA